MAYRWHPKYAEVDADAPNMWVTCSRCNFIWNADKMQWQYDYRGTSTPVNTRVLVCPKCMDVPQPQLAPLVLPPDPPPTFNARPENYTLDETSWLATEDGDTLATEAGNEFVTPIPNSADIARTSHLATMQRVGPGTAANATAYEMETELDVPIVSEGDDLMVTEAGP